MAKVTMWIRPTKKSSMNEYIYIYIESCLIPVTVKKRDFHIGTPQKVHKAKCFFWELAIGDLSGMICVCCLVPFCVLQFVLFGGLPRAILRAPVCAFWWVASCHFACSSLCFLVGCLVPFCVLQFVLFGGLPRAILRAPVCAFWWVASCHFACSSSCFLVGCLVPFCVLQLVLFGGLPRAILHAPVRAFWWVASCPFACSSSCFLVGCLVPFCVLQFARATRQSYSTSSKIWRFAGRIVVKFCYFPRAHFCALSCAHCYSQ